MIYFICVAHGWANFFIMATTPEEKPKVFTARFNYHEAGTYHLSCNMHIHIVGYVVYPPQCPLTFIIQ